MSNPISMKSLDERIRQVEDAIADLKAPKAAPAAASVAVPAVPVVSEPVPTDYRDIVDAELNRTFGITIETHKDAPLFTFTIVTPQTYSTLAPENGEDLRPKVMSFADGSAGVREWAMRVFNSFNPEVKARIVADRVNFVA